MKLMKRDQGNEAFPARAFRSAFDRVFDDFFNDDAYALTHSRSEWYPLVDVVEEKDHIKVKADLPGIDEKDLQVEVKDNILTIKGSREEKTEDKGERYYRVERKYGSFSREMQLPPGTDPDKIVARYEKGVLNLDIPKAESAIPKKIQVKSA